MATRAHDHGAKSNWDALKGVLKALFPIHKEIDRYLFDISLRRLFDEMLEEYVEHERDARESKFDLEKYSEQLERLLEEVMACLRQSLDSKQFDVNHLDAFAKVASFTGDQDQAQNASLVVDILEGEVASESAANPMPISFPDPEVIVELLRHVNDAGPAADLLDRVAGLFKKLPTQNLGDDTELEIVPGDPAVIEDERLWRWLGEWADFIGLDEFNLVELSGKNKNARAFPGAKPVVAISSSVSQIPSSRDRFFIGRSLFRAYQGFGAFKIGEVAGPIRWLMAVVVVVTREFDDLPVPTSRSFVDLLDPVLKLEQREELIDICNDVLMQEKQELVSWVESALFSADRFGLLLSGDPGQVINWILEDSSGQIGLERLKEDGPVVYTKVPRCLALLEFILSDEYVQLSRFVGERTPSLSSGK